MRKLVLLSILTIVFSIQAQGVKEVDLFMIGSLSETTRFPKQMFVAVNENAQRNKLGRVKAILLGELDYHSTYTIWFMTADKKVYKIYFDMTSKKAEICLDTLDRPLAITKNNLNAFDVSYLEAQKIKYFISDPDHRIPNDIPNSQNVLYDISP